MDKIFNQAKDKNVAAVVAYKKSNDSYAYANSTYTTKISADDLSDMYKKGMFVIDGNNTYLPVGLKVDDGVATVTYVTENTTTATTAVLATLVSEEYEESE